MTSNMTTTSNEDSAKMEGNVSAKGKSDGRDQIIHNIVAVGQLLKFAEVEGLIPKPPDSSDFESISAALEKTFGDRLENELAEAVAFAGEMLGDCFPDWIPENPLRPIPFRKIIPNMPPCIAEKLIELDYWEAFREKGYYLEIGSGPSRGSEGKPKVEVLFLHSLTAVWKRHHQEENWMGDILYNDKHFAIAVHHKAHFLDNARCCFATCKRETLHDRSVPVFPLGFTNTTNEQARIFLSGLVIDLIRMASTVSTDIKFWNGLVRFSGDK